MIGCGISCEKVILLSLALARGGLTNKDWYSQLEQIQQIRCGVAMEDGVAQGVSYIYAAVTHESGVAVKLTYYSRSHSSTFKTSTQYYSIFCGGTLTTNRRPLTVSVIVDYKDVSQQFYVGPDRLVIHDVFLSVFLVDLLLQLRWERAHVLV